MALHGMLLLALIIQALSATPAAGPDAPQVQVELRDGGLVEGRLAGFDGQALRLERPDGERLVAAGDLLLVHAPRPAAPRPEPEPPSIEPRGAAPPPADDLLLLAGQDGDRLAGRLVGGDADGVRFHFGGLRPADVPFERIERVLPGARLPVDRLALLPGAGDDDRLWRRREDGGLDSLTGVVDALGPDRVAFEGALGRLEFPLGEVVALVLAGGGPGDGERAGLPVVLRLHGGSRLSGGLVEVSAGRMVLATSWAGRIEVPTAALASLACRGPGRRLLADLAPVEVEERPTAGGPADVLFPWRRDLSVTGRLLTVDGQPRATGLGVHAWSRLAFDLPPGTRALHVTGGLCDEVGELPARASVGLRVLVDGQERARAAVLEGDPSARLVVDGLQGARRLELVADDGGDDDAGDRAAWVDGVLLGDWP